MHSKIYEIRDEIRKPEDWATGIEIGDNNGCIPGTDYYGEIPDADERVELINEFFLRYFPDSSFEIVSNKPRETACIKFVGNIHELYERWIADIKKCANELNIENISRLGLYDVRKACEQPFGLWSKFYIPDWNGCTVDADDFMDYLRHRNEDSNGEPFVFYVGQVFDYHF